MDKYNLLLRLRHLFLKIILWFLNSDIFGRYTRYLSTYLLYNQMIYRRPGLAEMDTITPVSHELGSFKFVLPLSYYTSTKSQLVTRLFVWYVYLTKHSELFRSFLTIFDNLTFYYIPVRFKKGYLRSRWYMLPIDFVFCFFPGCVLMLFKSLLILFIRLLFFCIQLPFVFINYPLVILINDFTLINELRNKPFAPFSSFTYNTAASWDILKFFLILYDIFIRPFKKLNTWYHKQFPSFYFNYVLPAFGVDILYYSMWMNYYNTIAKIAIYAYFQCLIFICLKQIVSLEVILIYLSLIVWFYLFCYFRVASREEWYVLLRDLTQCCLFVSIVYITFATWHDMHNLVQLPKDLRGPTTFSYLFIVNFLSDFIVMGSQSEHGRSGSTHTPIVNDFEDSFPHPRKRHTQLYRRPHIMAKLVAYAHYHDTDHVLRHFLFYEHTQRLLIGWDVHGQWLTADSKTHFGILYRGKFLGIDRDGVVFKPGVLEHFRKLDTSSSKLQSLFEEECVNFPRFAEKYTIHSRSWDDLSLARYEERKNLD